MKITIAQGAFLPIPPLLGGGVEKVWYGLVAEFQRQGHAVTYISRCYGDLPRDEVVAGIRYIRVPGFDTPASMLKLKTQDLIYSLRVRRTLPPADILVTHCFCLPMLVRNDQYGKLYVHVSRYPKKQMRFYRHAARLQGVSHAVGQAIIEQTPDVTAKVVVIPNSIVDAAFSSNDADALAHPRARSILYVGRVHPEKGIGLLLDAFTRFKAVDTQGWRLVIVGPWETRAGGGGESYLAQLREQSRSLGDTVVWTGPVYEADRLRQHYLDSSVFVYPSLADQGETFGLAPLEAMAVGCPAIVSDLACFKDYLQDGCNGLVFNHRHAEPAQQLVQLLTRLVGDEKLRRSLAECGIETARQYDMRHVADLYLNDFRTLLAGGGR
jgi:glycosyltransferase involved in cell wall biosynthesis